MEKNNTDLPGRLPAEPIDKYIDPIKRFMHVESASGIVLLGTTIVALVLANSDFADKYSTLWATKIGIKIGSFEMLHSVKHWINDFLMAIFFFVIGLEVKREIVMGELQDMKSAALPVFAAIGGMLVPAGLYLALQAGEPGARGWGIPMATDIAFVVGALAVLGKRIPSRLRIFLLSLAIVDDIGAILVIAVGYTAQLDYLALIFGIFSIGVFLVMQKIGVQNAAVYTFVALMVWFGFHESGIHATLAGVIVGLITPTGSWVNERRFSLMLQSTMGVLKGEGWLSTKERYEMLRTMERAARKSVSPLERFENDLHPWVSFLIMPLFALANAGVTINISGLTSAISFAIIVGLFIGKPVGIMLFSWLAIRMNFAVLPENITWRVILGGGFLAGIGFTMALFIASLALEGMMLDQAKLGIICGSVLSALIGVLILIGKKP